MNMINLEEEREKIRIRNWKKLTPHQKHYTLMYYYRLQTDIENIRDYYEAWLFVRSGMSPDQLPTFLANMKPHELRTEAYDVIGKLSELPKEPA